MGVSLNGGTPKSSILIGFSIINHPFWGTIIFGNTNMVTALCGCPGCCQGFWELVVPWHRRLQASQAEGRKEAFCKLCRSSTLVTQPREAWDNKPYGHFFVQFSRGSPDFLFLSILTRFAFASLQVFQRVSEITRIWTSPGASRCLQQPRWFGTQRRSTCWRSDVTGHKNGMNETSWVNHGVTYAGQRPPSRDWSWRGQLLDLIGFLYVDWGRSSVPATCWKSSSCGQMVAWCCMCHVSGAVCMFSRSNTSRPRPSTLKSADCNFKIFSACRLQRSAAILECQGAQEVHGIHKLQVCWEGGRHMKDAALLFIFTMRFFLRGGTGIRQLIYANLARSTNPLRFPDWIIALGCHGYCFRSCFLVRRRFASKLGILANDSNCEWRTHDNKY